MNDVATVENPFSVSVPQSGGALATSNQAAGIAEVQAKLLMAQQFPRNEVEATDKILNAFTRPRLAEQAKYQYARGGSDVDGPSIRSAEAIAQMWGNMEFGFRELSRGRESDGVTYSEVEAFAFDLQSRTRRPLQFRVRHWRDTRKGGYKITDERDIYELVSNMAQRRVRSCILAIVPGDVIEAAMLQAEITLKAKADTSPDAMKKMVEAFEPFGITKEHIEKRIQRRLDAIQAAQVVSLKKIYASLRDGMSVAIDWFDVDETEGVAATTSLQDIKSRKAAAKASKVDQETGEVAGAEHGGQQQAVGYDYKALLSSIQKAANVEALDLIGDGLRDLPEGNDYVKLHAAYTERREALAAAE